MSLYSGLSLTYQFDRLPAFSAVAEMFSPQFGEENYLAGLWRDALPLALLWIPNVHEKARDERPSPNPSAPSWSWVSLSSEIQDGSRFNTPGSPYLADQGVSFLDCSIHLANPAVKFGAVKRGELRLRGRLLPVRLCLEGIGSALSEDFVRTFRVMDGIGRSESEMRGTGGIQVITPNTDFAIERGLHLVGYEHPVKAYRDRALAVKVYLDRREAVANDMIRPSEKTKLHRNEEKWGIEMPKVRSIHGLLLTMSGDGTYARVEVFIFSDDQASSLSNAQEFEVPEYAKLFMDQYEWVKNGEITEFIIV
jgi:hypothetical protein